MEQTTEGLTSVAKGECGGDLVWTIDHAGNVEVARCRRCGGGAMLTLEEFQLGRLRWDKCRLPAVTFGGIPVVADPRVAEGQLGYRGILGAVPPPPDVERLRVAAQHALSLIEDLRDRSTTHPCPDVRALVPQLAQAAALLERHVGPPPRGLAAWLPAPGQEPTPTYSSAAIHEAMEKVRPAVDMEALLDKAWHNLNAPNPFLPELDRMAERGPGLAAAPAPCEPVEITDWDLLPDAD